MSVKLLSGAQKAAILLLSLGEDLASDLVSRLDPDEAKKILLHLSQMQRVEPNKPACNRRVPKRTLVLAVE